MNRIVTWIAADDQPCAERAVLRICSPSGVLSERTVVLARSRSQEEFVALASAEHTVCLIVDPALAGEWLRREDAAVSLARAPVIFRMSLSRAPIGTLFAASRKVSNALEHRRANISYQACIRLQRQCIGARLRGSRVRQCAGSI